MPRTTIVISQGQSASPVKRKLEEDLVGALLLERGCEVTVVPHLYDLASDSTGLLCLSGISGDVIVLSWLYARAAHWTLDRHGIKGQFGITLLASDADEDEDDVDEDDDGEESADDKQRVGPRDLPKRTIYHLDLRTHAVLDPYLAEIRRILAESSVQTFGIGDWPASTAPTAATSQPATAAPTNGAKSSNGNGEFNLADLVVPGGPVRVEETPDRRWYPVIDYSRCTNCMECIDFCLFGVYGVDRAETILVEQPDNCRKGCPACSRVCPENAIIFPQHKSPAIAGSATESAGGLKIDLSQLFGAPNAIEVAARERDVELVAVGRDAVGLSVGIPKRQDSKEAGPKDDLDRLMDQLDDLDL